MRQELLSHFTRRPWLVVVMVLLASLAVSATAIAAAGDLDPTFSGDGRQTTNFSPGSREEANGVAILSDGKIVVVGYTPVVHTGTDDDFAVARYNPNGTLDTTFSGDGKQTTSIRGQANGVAIQSSGKIVVVGNGGTSALARYNTNGSRDTRFAGDGSADFSGSANAVAIQANDRIVVVGGGTIARYNTNGSRDTSFSGNASADFNGGANAVVLQANGRIVVAGIASGAGGPSDTDFVLARYLGG